MKNIAYCDAIGGLSGNIFLGAVLHAGASKESMEEVINLLNPPEYNITVEKVEHFGIGAFHVEVEVDEGHHHRSLLDILKILKPLPESIREKAEKIFRRLAEAEGKVHGKPPETMHFHEVGQWDAIIDVVGTVTGLEELEVDELYSSPLPLGTGVITSAHGLLPVPAPATVEILRGVPTIFTGIEFELVTPTGAAILTALAKGYGKPPMMSFEKIGYGAGGRVLPNRPNLSRLFIGPPADAESTDEIAVLETNIDDQSPEVYEFLIERLLNSGALDVTLTPVIMKKNRPGVIVSVMAPLGKETELIDILCTESTTFGVRHSRVKRVISPSEEITVETKWGPVRGRLRPGPTPWFAPEYRDCKQIAEKEKLPLLYVYQEVQRSRK